MSILIKKLEKAIADNSKKILQEIISISKEQSRLDDEDIDKLFELAVLIAQIYLKTKGVK